LRNVSKKQADLQRIGGAEWREGVLDIIG